ncbi:MAG TPA: hypothetical protein VMN78_00455 [Longimicrobiales bacterium]|nr:hypothetical protein [Longimicrobiales bacterium]
MHDSITGTGLRLLTAFLVVVAARGAPVAAQQAPAWRAAAPAWSVAPEKSGRRAPAASERAPQATIVEAEPNDDLETANSVALSDTVSGVIAVPGDQDFFAIDLVQGTIIDFDVDAQVLGSYLDAILLLMDAHGYVIAFSDDADGLDSRIRTSIATTGRYYVVITDYSGGGDVDYTYRIRLGESEPGPGDPTTVRPSGADAAWAIAAGAAGEIYVLDWLDGDVWRVPASGSPTRLATTEGYDMALDAFGDLLLTQPDSGNIVRVATATGARSRFATLDGHAPISIAVGPDGDVWLFAVSEMGSATLFRLSPYGARRDSIDASNLGFVLKMTFSPSGTLHLSDGFYSIHRLNANGTFTTVFQLDQGVGGMSFDVDGSIYVSTPASGLLKLNSSYAVLHNPFARANIELSGNTAFLRTATGAMTSRLLASNLSGGTGIAGALVEMNPTGMTAVGARVGTDLARVTVTVDQAADHVLGAVQLDTDARAFLDGQGNGNGQVDVGDLRALVRATAPSNATRNPQED